jgi:hypothetical protein
MSVPVVASSLLVLEVNSLVGAVLTVVVANGLLWFLRLGMIAMAHEGRMSTLDVAREFLGKGGGYGVAALLLASTLAWFVTQTDAASAALAELVTVGEYPGIDQVTQVSVLLGIGSAFLCMEGMVLLRRMAVAAVPILLVVFVAILALVPERQAVGRETGISLAGLSIVLATNLGITADLPTFFRHSRSWDESVKGLTVVQVATLVLGIAGLFLGSVMKGGLTIDATRVMGGGIGLRFAIGIWLFVSVIAANVANVYAASVGWEVLAPKALVGRKEYLILGLGLTTIFILVSGIWNPEKLLLVTDASLVNLALVLVGGYVWSRRQPFGALERAVCCSAWLGATGVNWAQLEGWGKGLPLLATGAGVSGAILGLGWLWRKISPKER